jgi:hypothetical protein
LHLTIETPSALIPAQMLNENIITKENTNPFVGVKQPNIGENEATNIIRMFSKLNFSILYWHI